MSTLTESIKGRILSIERGSVHDGPGIRTTVFLKGCPLKCSWCHNPTSQETNIELAFLEEKCVHCAACVSACPNNCHSMINDKQVFNREKCNLCFACVDACVYGALRREGMDIDVYSVINIVRSDIPYYKNSGGGVTISGGEPLQQWEFTKAILSESQTLGIHTAIETCCFGSTQAIDAIIEYTDLFLIDYKLTDEKKHLEYTGVLPDRIRENTRRIDSRSKPIILRCPIIPGINDTDAHFQGIAEFANSLKNVVEINVLPYHPYGMGRLAWVGRTVPFDIPIVKPDIAETWEKRISTYTQIPMHCANTVRN